MEAAINDVAWQAIEYMDMVEKKMPINFRDIDLEK